MAEYTSEELLKLGKETNEMDFAIKSKFIPFDKITDILKICRKRHGQNYCLACPLNNERNCIEIMASSALDFINYLEKKNEKLRQPILVAENVEINKEEFLEKLQQSPIQPLPVEKQYEVRDCPFSPFDEYCTGHCVNCENWSEYIDYNKRLKVKAYKEVIEKLKEHLCNYDLPNYHSFRAVDEDTIDEILEEMAGE